MVAPLRHPLQISAPSVDIPESSFAALLRTPNHAIHRALSMSQDVDQFLRSRASSVALSELQITIADMQEVAAPETQEVVPETQLTVLDMQQIMVPETQHAVVPDSQTVVPDSQTVMLETQEFRSSLPPYTPRTPRVQRPALAAISANILLPTQSRRTPKRNRRYLD